MDEYRISGRDMKKFEKAMTRMVISRLGRKLESKIKDKVIEKKLVDTGMMLKSITFQPTDMAVVVGTPYAIYVEKGRRKGTYPPYEVIDRWVRRKLGIKRDRKAVVWKIMNKIKYRGIKGKYFVRDAVDELVERFR